MNSDRFNAFTEKELLQMEQALSLVMSRIRTALFEPSNVDLPPKYFLLESLRNEIIEELETRWER